MSYLDRVRACNRLDLKGQVPFVIDGRQFGWVSAARAEVLAEHKDVFAVTSRRVTFAKDVDSPAARTEAVAALAPRLAETGLFGARHGERYAVRRYWGDAPAFEIDRKLVPAFGLRAFGVHVNGLVHHDDGLHLWIGTRADDREVEPGKLDNIVAGGQPAGLSLMDNLIKECGEEADIPAFLARTAKPVGAISYAFTTPGGVKADTMFCFDLAMPEEVRPRNTDGEIAGFALMPLSEVLALVRDTERFKFNVNLVILDFALRHGALDPDREPDYEAIVAGLQRRPPHEIDSFFGAKSAG